MKRSASVIAACMIALTTAATATAAPAPPPPPAPNPPPTPDLARPNAVNTGDTHIYGVGITQTIDCNDGTLFVQGSDNVINAMGVCFAVTMQGSGNMVIAETVVNDITVYGFNQTVFFKNGDPYIWDRGREFGMTNRIDRTPA